MSYDKLKQAKYVLIGTKQTMKMVEKGNVQEVYVAQDADPRVVQKLIDLCERMTVAVTYVESMTHLGHACGIEVGAAVAALYKE